MSHASSTIRLGYLVVLLVVYGESFTPPPLYIPPKDCLTTLLSVHASGEVEDAFRRLLQIRCDGQHSQVRLTADGVCVDIREVPLCPTDQPIRHVSSTTALATCRSPDPAQETVCGPCLQIDDDSPVCQATGAVRCELSQGYQEYRALGLSICECLELLYYLPSYDSCFRGALRGPCRCGEKVYVPAGSVDAGCVDAGQVPGPPTLLPERLPDTLCLTGSRSASRGLCPDDGKQYSPVKQIS